MRTRDPVLWHPRRPLAWSALLGGSADQHEETSVTITGWPATAFEAVEARYCLLAPEPVCCRGCLPSDPAACIEVVASGARRARVGHDGVGWSKRVAGLHGAT